MSGRVAAADAETATPPRDAIVLVCSTRVAAGIRDDTTGPILRDWLHGRGWQVTTRVVADGDPVGRALAEG
ncbi:MAG: hypothetical protein WBP48_10130, partial [Microbacterium sp.]